MLENNDVRKTRNGRSNGNTGNGNTGNGSTSTTKGAKPEAGLKLHGDLVRFLK